jgi:ABC-type glutathione transport system ATPase component
VIWKVERLTKRYGTVTAVDGVDWAVDDGERVGLVGASGSGKTTLCRCGLGWEPVDGGSAFVAGQSVATQPAPPDVAQWLFQRPRSMLHPARRIRGLLRESAALFHHRDPDAAVSAALADVGLSHRADALPAELSGGEQRRAGIARVLLARPRLLVADEPTSGLDAALARQIADLLFAPDRATVLVTHDLPLALATCDRVVVFDAGRVVESIARGRSAESDVGKRLMDAAGVGVPAC